MSCGESAEAIVAPELGLFAEDHGLGAGGIFGRDFNANEAALRRGVDVFFAVDRDELARAGKSMSEFRPPWESLKRQTGSPVRALMQGVDMAAAGAEVENAVAAEVTRSVRPSDCPPARCPACWTRPVRR